MSNFKRVAVSTKHMKITNRLKALITCLLQTLGDKINLTKTPKWPIDTTESQQRQLLQVLMCKTTQAPHKTITRT